VFSIASIAEAWVNSGVTADSVDASKAKWKRCKLNKIGGATFLNSSLNWDKECVSVNQ